MDLFKLSRYLLCNTPVHDRSYPPLSLFICSLFSGRWRGKGTYMMVHQMRSKEKYFFSPPRITLPKSCHFRPKLKPCLSRPSAFWTRIVCQMPCKYCNIALQKRTSRRKKGEGVKRKWEQVKWDEAKAKVAACQGVCCCCCYPPWQYLAIVECRVDSSRPDRPALPVSRGRPKLAHTPFSFAFRAFPHGCQMTESRRSNFSSQDIYTTTAHLGHFEPCAPHNPQGQECLVICAATTKWVFHTSESENQEIEYCTSGLPIPKDHNLAWVRTLGPRGATASKATVSKVCNWNDKMWSPHPPVPYHLSKPLKAWCAWMRFKAMWTEN